MARTYREVKLRYGLAQRLGLTLLALTLGATTQAEITVDGSLGSFHGSLVGPAFQIDANLGKQVGTNLFHSFEAFNINHPERATFTANGSVGPIANVLSRVTGDNASTIDGVLRSTIPNANLFFFNPHGVAFGPHAQLDVPGSFHVSTADYLRLGDGVCFDAQPSAQDALLTTAPPAAFGFLGHQVGAIDVQGGKLAVGDGEALSVVGGDITIRGGELRAPSGRINLASVASKGETTLGSSSLSPVSFDQLGDIGMSREGLVSTSGEGGGAIFILGGQLVMNNNSSILAQTNGNEAGRVIDVKIDSLRLTNGSRISASTNSSGNGGNLTVTAQDITLRGRGRFASGLFVNANEGSGGNGGELKVTTKALRLSDGAQIGARTRAGSTGKGGNITLTTDRLEVTSGAQISASTESDKKGGDLTVSAQDIILQGRGKTASSASGLYVNANEGRGKGGELKVTTKTLRLSDGAQISARTRAGSTGKGGNITLATDRLEVTSGAQISASTSGSGHGGDLTVSAQDIILQGRGKTASSASGLYVNANEGRGNGGELKVTTKTLRLSDGAQISARTRAGSTGKGGNITLATDRLEVTNGATISASTSSPGKGGNLFIDATDIELRNGGSISAASLNTGESGTISIKALNSLRISDSRITVKTTQANAGDINLNVGTLLHLRDNSAITTSVAGGQGNGGNITIDPTFVVLDGSRIVANAVRGRGGNVSIVADHLFRTPDSLIQASSELGIQGTVDIKAPDGDVSAGLLALPAHFVDAAAVLTRPCAERSAADAIRLVVRKYEVLPDSPYALRVYLPSAGSDPNFPSDASQSSGIPDLYAAWDPRTYTCAFDLEQ